MESKCFFCQFDNINNIGILDFSIEAACDSCLYRILSEIIRKKAGLKLEKLKEGNLELLMMHHPRHND